VDLLGKMHQAEKYPMKKPANGKRYTFATRREAEGCKKKMRVSVMDIIQHFVSVCQRMMSREVRRGMHVFSITSEN
jgi:hypothetical protein